MADPAARNKDLGGWGRLNGLGKALAGSIICQVCPIRTRRAYTGYMRIE
jgi:hypothetical protein